MTILLDKELKTQQTVKFLENVLHASTDGILLTDVSQNIIFANEAFCDIIGHKKEQILETNIFTWLEQFSGDAIDSWVKLETSVNKQGKVRNIMFQKTIKDSIKYSSVNASLLERVDEEERGYIISIWRDITERKMVELKLKESEEKYRQLVENIPDAIYSTLPDETGTTTFMSNKWFAWSGFAPEDFYKDPKAWEKSIHPDDRDSTLKKFIEMCKQEKEYILEYRVLHKETGESSFLKDHGVPIYDHKGNISRYDGIVTDISDQKEVEKRLKESEMALRKSQQELKLKNQISNVFLTVPDEKMFGEVLSIILKTLKSEFGIFGYLDENENLVEPSLTEDVWEKCAIEDKIKVFPKKLWSKNIYGRVINEKNSLFVNKSFNVPEGHVPISNFLGTPIIYDDKVIGIFIVANKESDYEEYDVKQLESISNLIAPILSTRLERDRIEEKRKKAEKRIFNLAKFPSENPSPILRVTKDRVIYANQSAQELFNAYKSEIIPDLLRQSVNNVVNENLARNLELTLQNRVYSFDITPIENEYYVNIYGRNITKQKRAIKRIEDLARFPEENPSPVFRATKDRVIYANQACQDVFHIYSSEILPQLFVGIVNKALNENLAKNIEIQLNNRTYSLSVTPIKNTYYANIYVMDITERKKAEEDLKKSEYKLRERVKELNCLYGLSKLVEVPDISIEEVIEKALDLIHAAWQFPDITCARIIYKDTEFKTANFVKTKWRQKANIEEDEEIIGSVEVYYLKKMPKFNEGPFLKEERDLINSFAEILGNFFQRKEVELSINRLNLELERKVNERTEKLKESERKFRGIFEAIPDLYFLISKDGVYLDFNGDESKLFSSPKKFLGKNVSDIMPKENAKQTMEAIDKTLITRKPTIYEYALPMNNENRHYEARYLYSSEDKVSVFIRDITDRKITEIKLKKSEEKFRKMINDLDFGYYNITYNGKIVFHNPVFNVIFGFDPSEDLTGMSALDMWYNPTDRQKYLNELKKNNSIINFIFQGKNKNKEKILLELNSHLVRDKNGNPTNVEGTVIDVSDKFKLEQNLKEQNIRLREINVFKTNLLNRTSHELQTPLISIKGFTDILLDRYEDYLDEDMAEYLEIINKNANRLVRTIRSMIDTAYFEKDRLKMNMYLEDLAYLIRDCIKNNERLINLRNHSVDIDIQDVLITKFDKAYIYRVFESVLENAINNTPTGGKIQVHSKTQNNFIIISIKDNGVGLTKEEKTQIFQPFGKIERYGNGVDVVIEGLGLSLYLCKKIIELHNGKIWLDSAGKNKGSIFYFSLPLVSD